MNANEVIQLVEKIFSKYKKDEVIDYLSAVISELVSRGVSIRMCDTVPDYIEYVDDNDILQRIYGRYDHIPTGNSLTLDFSNHDKEVIDEFKREFAKNIPSAKGVSGND